MSALHVLLFCANQFTLFFLLQHHKNKECPLIPVVCHHCETTIVRPLFQQHIDPVEGDCSGVDGYCPYVKVGCIEKGLLPAKEKGEHLISNVKEHAFLFMNFTMKFKTEFDQFVSSNGNYACPQSTADYADRFTRTDQQLQLAKSMYQEHGLQLDTIRARLDRAERKPAPNGTFPNLGREQEGRLATVELLLDEIRRRISIIEQATGNGDVLRRLESLERSMATKIIEVDDLKVLCSREQSLSFNGTLVWKISDFARRRQDAISGRQVSFYSPTFYTSRQGYKMCSRIYLNGDGIGKGTHISLFFVLMRGEYDALLQFPFVYKVTSKLLDQDFVEDVVDAFRPDPNSSSFQRPKREANIASGSPLFMPLSNLHARNYVKDDTMFIKVIVDVPPPQ